MPQFQCGLFAYRILSFAESQRACAHSVFWKSVLEFGMVLVRMVYPENPAEAKIAGLLRE